MKKEFNFVDAIEEKGHHKRIDAPGYLTYFTNTKGGEQVKIAFDKDLLEKAGFMPEDHVRVQFDTEGRAVAVVLDPNDVAKRHRLRPINKGSRFGFTFTPKKNMPLNRFFATGGKWIANKAKTERHMIVFTK